ncbi:uncharacterized protein si:ch1073-126c3.2 [Trematomus bernacchii]|uniref:uncharacterized protein si:ch1073-126c3.2 n=1 Tax=Trematomus bernacchii TaxID=40690 RepID=UPI00146DB035|nr:uncharacterized protein si:ch1073-126c3.2 [Trematomus bernacchii]
MALQGALMWICSLAVLSSCAAQDESLQCGYQHLMSNLKAVGECEDSLPWSSQERAGLLLNLRNQKDKLYTLQLRECQGAEPNKCPQAEVPEDGGLLCTTVSNKRYCKPMCNHGHDFSFLRRSRVYEECSEQTGFKWRSQFIGGNKLAVCNKAKIQVSGAASAYFSEDQDCLTTKSNSSLIQSAIMGVFESELRGAGVQGDAENSCLLCG